jgi:Zn-dependent M28 family amino/carboxypeptidase
MKKGFALTFLFYLLINFSFGQQINTANLKKHIKYLADDKLKGRGTGTQDELTAANYIRINFSKLKLEPKGNLNSYYYSFKFNKQKDKQDTIGGTVVNSIDVVGYLNNDAENTIIIGAHYDHLGMGLDHNSLDPNPEDKIHNGADDNASGVAGVIELARYYSTNKVREKYNFLFICFSGEELGLFGSKKYCENPTIDFSKVDYMINMDMIGRLNDSTKRLIVYGVGTAPDFVPIIDNMQASLNIKKDSSGIGPSDQTSFYLKNIPVLHFFTGQHSDYHKPSDDVAKINFNGEKQVLEYIVSVIDKTLQLPKLQFLETRNTQAETRKYKITMGVMPDYAFEGKGMRIDGVTDGKPAFKAGIQKGDVVLQLGKIKVENINDYMKALGTINKGDTAEIIVQRERKEIKMNVTF